MSGFARSARVWAPIALVVYIMDQLSKQWALSALDDRSIEIIGSFRLTLAFNTGMAFGQGEGAGPLIGVVAFLVVIGVVVSIGRQGSALMQVAAGLIVGGALGNVSDRIFRSPGWFRGAVVDFIQAFDWFPIFNLADVGITTGGALLLLASWRQSRHPETTSPDPEPASA